MAPKKKTYQRLPGRAFSLIAAQKLWQASDHLLWVETAMFQERYKRFYYQDIQALVLCRTNHHLAWSFLWGAFALLFGIVAMSVSGTPYVSATLVIVFLLLLAMNLAMGPGCQVRLQTAVQVQQLKCLRRVRTANRAMDRILALIETAQGRLDLEALPASTVPTQAASLPATNATSHTLVSQARMDSTVGAFNPVWHRILFALLLAMGVIGLVQLGLKSLSVGIIEILLHTAAQVLVIVALVRGFRYLKGTLLAKISWLSLSMLILASAASYILLIAIIMRHPEMANNNWELYKVGFEIGSSDTPIMLALNLFFTFGSLLLGPLGLVALHRLPKSHATVQESKT